MHTYTFSAIEPGLNIETIAETAKNEHVGEHRPENEHMTPLPRCYHSDANKNIIFIPYSTHDAPPLPAFSFPADLLGAICGLHLQIYLPPGVAPAYTAVGVQLLGDMPLLPFGVPAQVYYEANAQLHPADDMREHHMFYYFRRVWQIQFLFTGPTVTSILHDLVVREPVGVVTHTICTLAALHKSQMRVMEGLEDRQAENSLYGVLRRFYNQTWWQLLDSRQWHRGYTEQDATAAIHLVSYWLFCGGGREWPLPLEVVCSWLGNSLLNTAPNVRLQWLQLSASTRFTAQMTMVSGS